MKIEELIITANMLMATNKGLLAMDESTGTCDKRFKDIGIPQTVSYRRAYRELIVTTPNLADGLSGAILFDETIYQETSDGISFVEILQKAGIIPGIKVDEGTVPIDGFPGEVVTVGLDTLRERLDRYQTFGMRFAKWRAVIKIDRDKPSIDCIEQNMYRLATYAAYCHEAGIVPIVEPEVLMDGDHTIEECFNATEKAIKSLFIELEKQKVDIRAVILKPNMVLSGKDAIVQASIEDVAEATVTCLLQNVPSVVAGIAFLSGGQPAELATARLNEMHIKYHKKMPWPLTFSYSRAVQQPALEAWAGKDENVKDAQKLLYRRIKLNNLARMGQYCQELEQF
jgi:fructose-bisphosphate aldolase class I